VVGTETGEGGSGDQGGDAAESVDTGWATGGTNVDGIGDLTGGSGATDGAIHVPTGGTSGTGTSGAAGGQATDAGSAADASVAADWGTVPPPSGGSTTGTTVGSGGNLGSGGNTLDSGETVSSGGITLGGGGTLGSGGITDGTTLGSGGNVGAGGITGGTTLGSGGNVGTGGITGGTTLGSGGNLGTGGITFGSGGNVGTGGITFGSGGNIGTGGITGGSGGNIGTGGITGDSGGNIGTGGITGGITFGSGGNIGTGGTSSASAGGAVETMIVSIDFVGGLPSGTTGAPATVVMAANEIAGVVPASHWNSAAGNSGSIASLVLADGSTSPASVVWKAPLASGETSATWSLNWSDAPGDVRMMNGYIDPRATASPATVTVTGLPSPMNTAYDVYVYCYSKYGGSGGTRTAQYAIGSTTYSVTQTGISASIFQGFTLASASGGNYVVFRNVTGTSFTLTATPGDGSSHRAPVNGIQIVHPSGS